jgi:hypothetical protein
MAKLFISEFGSMLPSGIPAGPAIAHQAPITIGATANSSAAFSSLTGAVRLHTDVICSYVVSGVGASPEATANHPRMAGNTTEYVTVQGGGKLSVITNT